MTIPHYMISSLPIWTNSENKGLDWYRKVADNKFPAKYLLARRISIPQDFENYSTGELWKIHDRSRNQLNAIIEDIKGDRFSLDEMSSSTPSLIDLNIELVNRMLASCTFCRWNCEVDRTGIDLNPDRKTGTCQLGEESRVGSFFHHRGEELVYRGHHGSGTIFFTSCNMRCQFCQNGNISQDKYNGKITSPKELAAMIWLLRMEGCHNINFVGGDPIIHLHTILRSFAYLDIDGPTFDTISEVRKVKSDRFVSYRTNSSNGDFNNEFNVPMLWNSNFFMTENSMKLLSTLVDIWLPDFKFGPDKKCATRLSRTPWYWETLTQNLKILYQWNEEFTIRHLVMPNHVECCTYPILEWISSNLPNIQVNIMDQYHPDSNTNPATDRYNPRYEDISRRLTQSEFDRCLRKARELDIPHHSISFS